MAEQDRLIYRARNSNLSEERRKQLVFTEIELVDKDIEAKSIQTRCKSNIFGIVNNIITGLILLCSGIITFYQALSDCENIAIIALSSSIFVAQGLKEFFKLGDKGFFYKQGTIRLRRLKRQTRDLMYLFHTFSVEQILSLVSQLRTEFDDRDLDLYKMSMFNEPRYDTGLRIVNNDNNDNDRINLPSNTPIHLNRENIPNQRKKTEGQHLHIHLDSTPPISRNLPSTPGIPMIRIETDSDEVRVPINEEDFEEIIL